MSAQLTHDILGISPASSQAPKVKSKKRANGKKRVKRGIDMPSIAPVRRFNIKDKRPRTIHWKLERIISSARDTTENPANDVELYHFVKFWNAQDYRYAKANKKIKILQYTDEEYNKFCHVSDWTREETDNLFKLCNKFDLRFILVEDRYNPPESKERQYKGTYHGAAQGHRHRSIEELKNRFYSIQKALIRGRQLPNTDRNPAITQNYDMNHEQARKLQLEKLFRRSKESEREMAELVLENRKNDLAIRQLRKEHKELRSRIRQQRNLGLAGRNAKQGATAAVHEKSNSKKSSRKSVKTGSSDTTKIKTETAVTPAVSLPIAFPFTTDDLPKEVVATDIFKNRSPGVYLRSSYPKSTHLNLPQRQISFVEQQFHSLGFTKPLAIPTSNLCQLFDQIRTDIVTKGNVEEYLVKQKTRLAELKAVRSREVQQTRRNSKDLSLQPPKKRARVNNSSTSKKGS